MTISERKQQLEELEILKGNILPALNALGGPLQRQDKIATLLEDSTLELDETMLADIMLSVFKAGKIVGKEEFQQRISLL